MGIIVAAKNNILINGFSDSQSYILLGKGTTPVNINTDTKLGNEVLRLPAMASRSTNKLYFTAIIASAMSPDTYTEIGLVIQGHLTKDTGQLVSRSLYSFTKVAATQYIIQVVLEFTGFGDIT